MAQAEKPIRLSGHARDQLFFRGGTEQEVVEVIRTGPWRAAELGRLESQKDFPCKAEWHRRRYATKRVCPICVDEPDAIVVVTVLLLKGAIMDDRAVDARSIRFQDTTGTPTHLAEGIAADDADGHVGGIEILDATKRLGDPTVFKQIILEDVALGQTASKL